MREQTFVELRIPPWIERNKPQEFVCRKRDLTITDNLPIVAINPSFDLSPPSDPLLFLTVLSLAFPSSTRLTGQDWRQPSLVPGPGSIADASLAEALKHYLEPVTAQPGVGLIFPQRGATVSFGDSAQDVVACLGRPDDVYYKVRF